MAHKYGGVELPALVPMVPTPAFPPVQAPGDPLLGYLADFIKTVMQARVGALWNALQPNVPLVKTVHTDDPSTNMNEQWLPAIFIYRPGRETREVIESFEQTADDYRFQKGRVVIEWILNTSPQENRRQIDHIVDVLRKAIDAAIHIGRDPSWIVPGDTDLTSATYDPKAELQGSSLLGYTGAAVIEVDHAGPGVYIHKMKPPAVTRNYEELKMSFFTEELLVYDPELVGDPNQTLATSVVSPDQGTGLGPFILGDAIYD